MVAGFFQVGDEQKEGDRMKREVLGAVVLGIMFSVAANAGPQLNVTEDGSAWIKPAFLGQVHYRYQSDAADEEDFYLRRGRIILIGQIQDGIKFFVETDNDKAGMNGVGSVSTDIQDAFVDFRLFDVDDSQLWLKGGLILLPFSFESVSSAASLLGHDYNAEQVKLVNSFVWRDYGAELHGNVAKRFAYRVGVFDGYDAQNSIKNDDAGLRFTGHVALNLIGDVETSWFYSQSRLGKGSYLSVGAGVDLQSDATAEEVPVETAAPLTLARTTTPAEPLTRTVVKDSEGYVVDVQSGVKLNESLSVTLNGAWYNWDNAAFDGNTAFVEGGVLVDKVMLTGKYGLQDPSEGDSVNDFTAGVHYFFKGHNARVGVEYRWGDSDDQVLAGVQFLL